MNRFAWMGFLLLFVPAAALAETMYVGEIVNITVRTGQGTDHKIIEMIRSGQQVEVLEPGQNWTRVRLPSGKEGWVLTRLLTRETPSRILYDRLKKEHESLLVKVKAPIEEIKKLEQENQQLTEQLAESEKAFHEVKQAFDDLKSRSTDLSGMETEYQQSAERMAEMKQKNDQLDEALARLQRRQIFRWFLAGAAVLLLGLVIGASTRSKRRRSSLI